MTSEINYFWYLTKLTNKVNKYTENFIARKNFGYFVQNIKFYPMLSEFNHITYQVARTENSCWERILVIEGNKFLTSFLSS
ncbi:hypothetical protein [uncultured Nostoc sp.]|uniref:hypothetical protein n=1 Tax=uncultured Nostoc sp. TaxID=340711 RepID=UPI0035CB522D